MNITVLGGGTWGLTLADLLYLKNNRIKIWEISKENIENILSRRGHPRLPALKLSDEIEITDNIEESIEESDIILIVVPARFVRETLNRIKNLDLSYKTFVICSKGIEEDSLMLLTDVAIDVLGEAVKKHLTVLSGPSHAEEVSKKLPTTVVVSGYDISTMKRVQELFITPYFRVYTQKDIKGVEIGASVKNVIAIAAGASDGFGFGDNTKAALITRGLTEIARLGLVMDAKQETFSGLAGLGDLVVTCNSKYSRNWTFGNLLAKGYSIEKALNEINMIVEGYYTVKAAYQLSKKFSVYMPITEEVYKVLYESKNPKQAVVDLMTREPKPENINFQGV